MLSHSPWQICLFASFLIVGGHGCQPPKDDPETDTETTSDDLPCEPISSECGPSVGIVERVIDGDTIVLEGGQRVRYLMVDTPEFTKEVECYGEEAYNYNKSFVEGQTVCLYYDNQECKDHFGRLLAYVETADGEINTSLLIRGFGCLCYIPPSGEDRRDEFTSLESQAKAEKKGLWGACSAGICGCS